MLVAVPGLGANVDVPVAIHVGGFGLVTSLSFQDYVLYPSAGLSIGVFPDETLVNLILRKRPSAREDIEVAIVVEIRHG